MFRRATASDAKAILRVRVAAIQGLASSHYPQAEIESWCAARTVESYYAEIEQKVVLVHEQDNELVAVGQLNPTTAFIEAIYVHPSHSSRGVGQRLLYALEVIAAERGIRELALEASLNAVEFYRQAGYVPVPREMQGQSAAATTIYMQHRLHAHTSDDGEHYVYATAL
jgi:putative acetyltransferase